MHCFNYIVSIGKSMSSHCINFGFFLLFGNQAAKRVGCPDAGPDAAADAVAAAADVREGLRVVYAKLGG